MLNRSWKAGLSRPHHLSAISVEVYEPPYLMRMSDRDRVKAPEEAGMPDTTLSR